MGDYVPNIVKTLQEEKNQAKLEEKLRIAKKLLEMGLDMERTIQATDLTKEQIEGNM